MKRARDARAKRAKEEKNAKKEAAKAAQGSPLNEDLFSPSKMAELKASYGASAPFPHLVVPNLCSAERARLIEVEARTGLKADFKETDLFKVYQTPDLGNLGLGAALADDVDPEDRSGFEVGGTTAAAAHWDAPQLMALRDALYSERFRDWVSELSGCGKLEPKADCSCNAYVEGGHLLCHDDVINTRRVSYIIYLNDPEQPWEACDGGALELYPLNPQLGIGHPDTIPVKNVLPNFNQMFLFTVVPGESFHAVQEVVAKEKPRLSISGWFHGSEPPPGMEHATRMQLQGPNADATEALAPWQSFEVEAEHEEDDEEKEDMEGKKKAAPATVDEEKEDDEEEELPPVFLSDADVASLAVFMNPDYLKPTVLEQLRERWLDPEEGSAVQLDEFLNPTWSALVDAATKAADARDGLGTKGRKGGGVKSSAAKKAAVAGKAEQEAAAAASVLASPVDYRAGLQGGWEACGPVHKQRFLRFNNSDNNALSSTAPSSSSSSSASFASLEAEVVDESGALLEKVRVELLGSAPFRRWLRQVTRLRCHRGRSLCRRFRPGLDYTVAHAGTLVASSSSSSGGGDEEDDEDDFIGALDATLCFVNDGSVVNQKGGAAAAADDDDDDKEDDDDCRDAHGRNSLWHAWDGGEVGGFECYVEAEEPSSSGEGGEQEGGEGGASSAPEVYQQTVKSARESGEGGAPSSKRARPSSGNAEGEKEEEEEDSDDDSEAEEAGGTLLSVQGRCNCLNLVVRDPGVMRFVKYVSYAAPGSRWDVAAEFEVE